MDKRVYHSESKLKKSFIDLMERKDPSDISVKEICVEAGLNRSTFYDRFGYIDKLAECIIRDCLNEVCDIGDGNIYEGDDEQGVRKESIRRYIDRFLSNRILMKFCESTARYKYYYNIISIQVSISRASMPDSIAYYPAYFQNTGVLGVLLEWISNRMDVPEEHIVDLIHEYSKSMYHKY